MHKERRIQRDGSDPYLYPYLYSRVGAAGGRVEYQCTGS